jgi:hypothetical protein
MLRAELVVAIGENEQDGQRRDPASEERDEVECRLVGPIHVLERDDERLVPLAQALQQHRKQRVPLAAGVEQRSVVPLERDVAKRTQRRGVKSASHAPVTTSISGRVEPWKLSTSALSRCPPPRQPGPSAPCHPEPARARSQAYRAPARVRAIRSRSRSLYGEHACRAPCSSGPIIARMDATLHRWKDVPDRAGRPATKKRRGPKTASPRDGTAYFPSRSESPGVARSIASLTRWNESFAAYFASFHVSRDVPLTRSQSFARSRSTSSNVLS